MLSPHGVLDVSYDNYSGWGIIFGGIGGYLRARVICDTGKLEFWRSRGTVQKVWSDGQGHQPNRILSGCHGHWRNKNKESCRQNLLRGPCGEMAESRPDPERSSPTIPDIDCFQLAGPLSLLLEIKYLLISSMILCRVTRPPLCHRPHHLQLLRDRDRQW